MSSSGPCAHCPAPWISTGICHWITELEDPPLAPCVSQIRAGSSWARDRCERVWRNCGECYAACNIIQHDRFGGWSVMVWGGISIEGRTDLYRLDNSTLIAFMPDLLSDKLTQLSVPTFICQWMPSLQKLFSNITTANTPPRWQLICCWRWLSGQVCLQTWTLLSTCGASSSGRWRSTVCLTSSSSVMSLVEEDASNNLCSSGEFHAQEDEAGC